LEEFIRDHGGIPAPKGYRVGELVYPKATCISLNEVVCHGIPDDTVVQESDILNIDVTTILDGYYGDTSKMFYGGGAEKVDEEALKLCQNAHNALFLGIAQVKPGAHVGDIGAAIAHAMHAHGYGVVESFCGHGTGVLFHEPPSIPHVGKKGTGPLLEPGMVFTIEPMINMGTGEVVINEADGWTVRTADDKLSAQWEHTLLVTDQPHGKETGRYDGCEILTFSESTL
jgi:methionyl aminopeptidase